MPSALAVLVILVILIILLVLAVLAILLILTVLLILLVLVVLIVLVVLLILIIHGFTSVAHSLPQNAANYTGEIDRELRNMFRGSFLKRRRGKCC